MSLNILNYILEIGLHFWPTKTPILHLGLLQYFDLRKLLRLVPISQEPLVYFYESFSNDSYFIYHF